MIESVAFRVLGVPAPQGSKTAVSRGGKAHVIEGGSATGRAKHKAWRLAVAETAREAWGDRPPLNGPVKVWLTFYMPRPTSARRGAVWAHKRPDLDKLVRSTLDGLADAGVCVDDSRVVSINAVKVYAERALGADVQVDGEMQ